MQILSLHQAQPDVVVLRLEPRDVHVDVAAVPSLCRHVDQTLQFVAPLGQARADLEVIGNRQVLGASGDVECDLATRYVEIGFPTGQVNAPDVSALTDVEIPIEMAGKDQVRRVCLCVTLVPRILRSPARGVCRFDVKPTGDRSVSLGILYLDSQHGGWLVTPSHWQDRVVY